MLTRNVENKTAAKPSKCPQCKQVGRACREVPLGWWCSVDGLIEDPSRWLHPSPNPQSEYIAADPAVSATAAEVERADAEVRRCHEAWLSACLAAARAGLQGTPRGVLSKVVGAAGRVSADERERLTQLVEDALDVLDDAQARLGRARSAHQRAYERAMSRYVNAERNGSA